MHTSCKLACQILNVTFRPQYTCIYNYIEWDPKVVLQKLEVKDECRIYCIGFKHRYEQL